MARFFKCTKRVGTMTLEGSRQLRLSAPVCSTMAQVLTEHIKSVQVEHIPSSLDTHTCSMIDGILTATKEDVCRQGWSYCESESFLYRTDSAVHTGTGIFQYNV